MFFDRLICDIKITILSEWLDFNDLINLDLSLKTKNYSDKLNEIYDLPYFKIETCFKLTRSNIHWIVNNRIKLINIELYYNQNFITPYLSEYGHLVKKLTFSNMNIYQIKDIFALCKNTETVSIIDPFVIHNEFIGELKDNNISNLYLSLFFITDDNFVEKLDMISLKFKYIEVCLFSETLNEKIQEDISTKCNNIKVSSVKSNEIVIKKR